MAGTFNDAQLRQQALKLTDPYDQTNLIFELAPEAVLSSVAPPVAGSTGEWRRIQEQSVERPALAPGDRELVGRYFKRGSGGGGP